MATPTYDLIASANVTFGVKNFSVTGIPNTYKDLVIVLYCGRLVNNSTISVRYNGQSNNYTNYFLVAGAASSNRTDVIEVHWDRFSTGNGNGFVWIHEVFDYASTSVDKSGITKTFSAPYGIGFASTNWSITSTAINSVSFSSNNGDMESTTVSVYGVTA